MDITSGAIEKTLARIQDADLRQEIGAIINALLEQYNVLLDQNKLLQDRVSLL